MLPNILVHYQWLQGPPPILPITSMSLTILPPLLLQTPSILFVHIIINFYSLYYKFIVLVRNEFSYFSRKKMT